MYPSLPVPVTRADNFPGPELPPSTSQLAAALVRLINAYVLPTAVVRSTSNHALLQYINNVINNGTSDYAQAYFELNYIRAFGVNSSVVVDATGSQVTATATGSSGQIFPTQSGSSGNSGSNGATAIVPALLTGAVGLLGAAAWFAML